MSEFATPREALSWVTAQFVSSGMAEPHGEARYLAEFLFGTTTPTRPLRADEIARTTELVQRRLAGEPLGYVVGRWPFRSLMLVVDRRVLVPRPATETLVDLVIDAIGDRAASVADVCTGSGVIALTIAVERPATRVVATDLSSDALAVARINLDRLHAVGRAKQVELREGDLVSPLRGERFDLIASNPPYIPSPNMARLQREVLHEPHTALESGLDGLDAIRRLIPDAREHLVAGGLLAIEHDVGQHDAVADLFRAAGYTDVGSTLDKGNVARVTSGRR